MKGALKDYRRMRNFRATREPRGGRPRPAGRRLRFFVQRHAASRLHYDFRLELDGALKSWAVPKGPSVDPRDRRLAVRVEDHPLEYGSFEGEIPKGQYGAGTVRLWDRGRWIPEGDPRDGYRTGKLKFRLEGKRLKGRWTLVRMSGAAGANGKNWLLIKEKEPGFRPAAFKGFVKPQLPTLAAKVPSGDRWVHELKADGFRIQARADRGAVELRTRRGLDWTPRFKGLAEALSALAVRSAVLDGEAVVLDERGRSSMPLLRKALSEKRTGGVVFYAFDLLELNGRDLRGEPLIERKAALKRLLDADPSANIRYSEHLAEKGEQLFSLACETGLEGVVSKRKDAPYRSGRSSDWLKVKCVKHEPPRLTHPERVLYPDAGVTKLELAQYYEAAAERLLPFVANRPLALLRCPGGVGKPCFYQKHESSAFGAAVRVREGNLFVEDAAGLAALVQAGVLEIHPWGSRIDSIESPDNLVFDIDPGEQTPWREIAAAAREVRARLEHLGLGAFLKTTGGRGLHVVVPLTPGASWPEAKAFCRSFAELMAADEPKRYTTKLRKDARGGRIFIDWLRNQRGSTAVAAYSPRAREGATVSTPLSWDELTPSMRSNRFSVRTILPRLKRDPWKGFEEKRSHLLHGLTRPRRL